MSKHQEQEYTCPITLEAIDPKYDITITFDDTSASFHYDVRALLEYIQSSPNPTDPMTRKAYSNEQIENIKQKASKAGESPIPTETKNAILAIDNLMKEVGESARFLTMSSLVDEIDEYLYQTKQFFLDNGTVEPVDPAVLDAMFGNAAAKKAEWQQQIQQHRRIISQIARQEQMHRQEETHPPEIQRLLDQLLNTHRQRRENEMMVSLLSRIIQETKQARSEEASRSQFSEERISRVMSEANVDRQTAIDALELNDNDLVGAILFLTPE